MTAHASSGSLCSFSNPTLHCLLLNLPDWHEAMLAMSAVLHMHLLCYCI